MRQEQLIELEKRMKQNAVLREKAKAEADFEEEKTKLDRALAMDVITQDEYNFKISVAKKRIDSSNTFMILKRLYTSNITKKDGTNTAPPVNFFFILCVHDQISHCTRSQFHRSRLCFFAL